MRKLGDVRSPQTDECTDGQNMFFNRRRNLLLADKTNGKLRVSYCRLKKKKKQFYALNGNGPNAEHSPCVF